MTPEQLQSQLDSDTALQAYLQQAENVARKIGSHSGFGQSAQNESLQKQLQNLASALPPSSKALLQQINDAGYVASVNAKSGRDAKVSPKGFDTWANIVWGIGLAAVGGIALGGETGVLGGTGNSTASAAAAAPSAGASEFAAVGGSSGVSAGLPTGAVSWAAPAGSAAAPGATAAGIVATSPTTYKDILNLLKAGGGSLGSANSAAQNNQQIRADNQVKAATAEENAYLSDAELERQQRADAVKDVYRDSVISSGNHSPFDPAPQVYSDIYKKAVGDLSRQGATQLAQDPIYGIRSIPKPNQLFPDPATAFQETGAQKVGDWLAPALSIAGSVPPSIYSQIWNWL